MVRNIRSGLAVVGARMTVLCALDRYIPRLL